MANLEQLRILRQGVGVWNEWRQKNRDVPIDLSEANLDGTDLRRFNLYKADLNKASLNQAYLNGADLRKGNLNGAGLNKADLILTNLSEADLSGSDLGEADLNNAKLTKAYLKRSYLSEANLSRADLSKANLDGANLKMSIFSETFLNSCNFKNCRIDKTIFSLTNLSSVKNLHTAKVSGECSIDFQTLHSSNLPKEFLLKIGLPENYINYLPDFYDESPIRMFPVFLSHSWSNKKFAGKLYDALIKKGVHVWYDEKKLKPGDKIFDGISKGIDVYDKMILVCSKQSLEESWWVDQEMERIFKKERQYLREKGKRVSLIIPITIDNHIYQWQGSKGESIRDKVIGDFTKWENDIEFEKSLNQLVVALNVDREKDERLPPSFLPK